MTLYIAAKSGGTDMFQLTHNLLIRIGGILTLAFILFVGVKAMSHVANDKPLAAVALVVIALIPAVFILDPGGATNMLKSAVHSIGG